MEEYTYEIQWDGYFTTLPLLLMNGLREASYGKYSHGKVIEAKLTRTEDSVFYLEVTVKPNRG